MDETEKYYEFGYEIGCMDAMNIAKERVQAIRTTTELHRNIIRKGTKKECTLQGILIGLDYIENIIRDVEKELVRTRNENET